MIWRETLVLLRLPVLRLRFSPRKWTEVRAMRVGVGPFTARLEVVVVEEKSVRGGRRRWLRCRCGRHTSILGMSLETGDVACRVCWRWRTRTDSMQAPHAAHGSMEVFGA